MNTPSNINWDLLLRRIRDHRCTPFLGAGINHGILPLGPEIAERLAQEYNYPLSDRSDLSQVAQFIASTEKDGMLPKEKVLEILKEKREKWQKGVTLPGFFKTPDEPLSILASLPFPIYMTTNYDSLMVEALKAWDKDPRRELCRWNDDVQREPSVFDSASGFDPTPANPVVFHLHGHDAVYESLVLTEDDYLSFLVYISRNAVLPPRIEEAMTRASLLFMGYRLADWDFRVLFRGLVGSMDSNLRRINVAVQLPPEGSEQEQRRRVQEYLVQYFDEKKVQIYWGTAEEFAIELRDRWKDYESEHPTQ